MLFLLTSIHVIVCLFLIMVVLLQQGKGADLSVFGGGATMTAFGVRGAASLLHKLTVTGFVLYIVTTLGIGVFQGQGIGGSVMPDAVPAETGSAAPAETGSAAPAETESGALPAGSEPDPTSGEQAPEEEAYDVEPPTFGEEEPSGEQQETP